MINGVAVKKITKHPDERGYFLEIIRSTDGFFAEGFAQLSHSHMIDGVVKAWHIHKSQIDWWYVVSGNIKAVLYDPRIDSSTYKQINEFSLGVDSDPMVLKIPAGIAHGLKVLKGPADLIYVTSSVYNPEEEGRILYNDSSIGYDWIDGKPITNKKIT
jgi:dTDP-4-dehydrorhamnose 3,5-epimerase